MEVGHNLPCVRPAVDGHPVTAFGNTLLPGHLIGCPGHLPDERGIFIGHVRQGGDMFPGDDEQVYWGQGVDIAEDDNILILVK